MADENKPAFYPRVGRTIAKNFRSAQPPAFIEDPRAMDLPQFGDVDLSVPSRENLEMARRMAERDAQLRRQQQADRSPLEKLAGGLQAGRLMGSALAQSVASIPTAITKGSKAAEDYIAENMYKPTQPLAYEYAGDVGDFLEKLETQYKIPPILPEAVALQYLTGPATSQATRAAGRGAEQAGMAMERVMEPVVRGALEQGGLPREMALGMGANTQSNVVKPYGGNWLGGGEKLGIPENDLRRLKRNTAGGNDPVVMLRHMNERYTPEALANMQEGSRRFTMDSIEQLEKDVALNNWVDRNLTNYVKKEMGTPDDPVRKLAEEGIIHTPLREDLDRMEYLQAIRKAEGYPAEGMGKSALAKQWENLADDAIRVTKAGKIQEMADISAKLDQARTEMNDHLKKLDQDFLVRMGEHVGNKDFNPKEVEMLMKMPPIQKAEILGDTKFAELKENLYNLMAREQGFEKRAGELNPFVAKLDPETRLYSGGVYDLGFDHILDVLREDVNSGRIRPDQLNKVSMEQAVRRTFEYDQELAKKMAEARLTARAELPVYKDYPEEGYRWVQLTRPGDFAAESDAMGHSVRGYEPPKGSDDWTEGSGDSGYGGYGLGGWNAIKRGDAKVYSLVDSKGEPHVTIEVGAYKGQLRPDDLIPYKEAALEEAKKLPNGYTDYDVRDIEIRMAKENMPAFINQIKGKQNAKPKSEYLPFVRDFVQGGNWSDVRDFQNTGLEWRTTGPQGIFMAEDVKALEQAGYRVPKYLTTAEKDDLAGKLYELQTGNDYNTGLPKVPPAEGMKRGGVVISNNPDAMMLELNNQKMKNGEPAYAGGKLITSQAVKAAKVPPPIRFPVTRGPSIPEIRAMAERMAPQVMGEFVRAAPTPSNPKPSTSVVGKTQKQFEREKTLPIEYQNIKEPVTPEEFDYAKKKGALLIGAQGDVTPGNRMLMSIDEQPLSVPVHLQAGPEWELYNPSAWAASDQMAKTYMNRAGKAAEAYDADPYLHYHKMTPDANFYAMHHLNSILGHLRPEELMLRDPKLYQQMVEEIRTRDVGYGKHPEFEGFEDPLNLQIHAQMDPNFRRHLSAIFNGPKFTERYGLNSGQDVLAATSLPELRDLEAGASGYAVVPLDVKAPLKHFEAESQTYDTGFPKAGASGRSKYPSPYQLIYRDTLNWMKENPSENKSSEFGRMNMIVPKQQIDNELIEAIGEYQRRMKELTGKKKGGAVKKAEGGAITGDDLILEERPL